MTTSIPVEVRNARETEIFDTEGDRFEVDDMEHMRKRNDIRKTGISVRITRIALIALEAVMAMLVLSETAFASGDVAGAIQGTWDSAKEQIKMVVNNVVFPVIDLILAVLFFVKLAMAYMDYRKHGQFEWTAPAILFGTLVFSLTAPLYVWQVIGI